MAAAKQPHLSYIPLLLKNLEPQELVGAASRALVAQGEHIISYLPSLIDSKNIILKHVFYILSNISTEKTKCFVLNYLDLPELFHRFLVASALNKLNFNADSNPQILKIEAQINKEINYLKKLLYYLHQLIECDETASVIFYQIRLTQQNILLLLSLLSSRNTFSKIRQAIASDDETLLSYANELFLFKLPSHYTKSLIPLICFKTKNEFLEQLRSSPSQKRNYVKIFESILQDPDFLSSPLIYSIIIYLIGKLKYSSLKDCVINFSLYDDALVDETKEWTLKNI